VKTVMACWIVVGLALLGLPARADPAEPRDLPVHLAQANDGGPYTFVRAKFRIDWLYRQPIAGVGTEADSAEASLRNVFGAAAGWIDRPVSEEDLASLLMRMMPRIAVRRETAEIGLLKIVPAALGGDQAASRESLRRTKDPAARTDYYIQLICRHGERGGTPSGGRKKDDHEGTPRVGWTGNPCWHAALMPCSVRALELFDLSFRQEA